MCVSLERAAGESLRIWLCRRQSMSLQMQLAYHFNADQYFYVSESWHTHGRLIHYPHLAGIQHIFKQWHMLVGASSNTDLIKLDNRLQSEIASYVSEYSCIVREGWHIDVNGETPRQVGQHWNRSNQHLRHTGHVISCHLFNQLILVHQYELIFVHHYEANIETRAAGSWGKCASTLASGWQKCSCTYGPTSSGLAPYLGNVKINKSRQVQSEQ